MTKRSNHYLSKQLGHVALATLFRSKGKKDKLKLWAHTVSGKTTGIFLTL
jgi:hypothetical protein